jgi:glycyl-radical enzyme activating protein
MTDAPGDVRGMIFDIQRMCIHDGPGIRTTVFLKGCPLECPWCHNPEGRLPNRELAYSRTLCIGCNACARACPHGLHAIENGVHRFRRDGCRACFACAEACPSGAIEVIGREMSVDTVMQEVLRDRVFYEVSNGGMTVSGGEPLQQPEFAASLLRAGKAAGLHTALETSGCMPREQLAAVVSATDLFLFDYKETDPERHLRATGCDRDRVIDSLRYLDAQGVAIVLRCPIVPGANLRDDHIEGIADVARSLQHLQEVHVMGYHPLGQSKRERLGTDATVPFRAPSRDELTQVAEWLRAHGVEHVNVD